LGAREKDIGAAAGNDEYDDKYRLPGLYLLIQAIAPR